MKTLLMFGSIAVLALSAGAEVLTVSTANTIGIQRVAKNTVETVVPVVFEAVGGGDVTLNNTLYLDNLSLADTVMMMQNSQFAYYTQWIWLPGFKTDLYWTARRDDEAEVLASNQTLQRGLGLRLSLAKSATPVYTYGQYTTDGLASTFNKNSTTFLANPYSLPLDLEKAFVASGSSGFTALDQVVVQDGNRELAYKYVKAGDPEGTGRHWCRTEVVRTISGDEIVASNKAVYDLKPIPAGGVFRFKRGFPVSGVTVNW